MMAVASLFVQAGVPPGVFQTVNGTAACCTALISSPSVSAVTFVGSSPIACTVAASCQALNKRVLALGGAKNHLVALPDCAAADAARDIVASFAGAAGQRCMAASVLLVVGEGPEQGDLVERVVAIAAEIKLGQAAGEMGPVIDGASRAKILRYIEESEKGGAEILLDGRIADDRDDAPTSSGFWIKPTIILHGSREDRALHDEIFGPVLSVLKVASWQEAIEIENASPFGNAACIYTSKGGSADWFASRFRAGMLGVNVGVPVPREPFSFGGLCGTESKYGDFDITGDGAVEFFSNRIKVTTKWPAVEDEPLFKKARSGGGGEGGREGPVDQANFNGRM